MLKLTVLEGPDTGAVYSPPQTLIVIGRHSDCHVMLHDASVSERHCEIRQDGTHFVLHARKSRNGTFINDQPDQVETYRLRHLDRIRLGRSCLQIDLPGGGTPEIPLSESPARQEPQVENPSDATIVQPIDLPTPSRDQPSSVHTQPRVTLQITEGPGTGKTFESHVGMTRFTIGRSPATDFTLEDKAVSRTHFVIEITPSGVVLTDEGSLNGTYVNDQRVSQTELSGGEEIRVCTTRMHVQISGFVREDINSPIIVIGPELGTNQPTTMSAPVEAVVVGPQATSPVVTTSADKELTSPSPIRRQQIFLAVIIAGLGIAVVVAWIKPILFARGSLSSVHTHLESECSTCHPSWGRRSIDTTCGVSDCHPQVLQASTQIQDRCTMCHKEHRGRTFLLRGTEEQCWQCHKDSFQSRPMRRFYANTFLGVGDQSGRAELRWAIPGNAEERRTWQESGPHTDTGLRFAHAAHAKSSQVDTCLNCHQPLPGEIINALGSASAFPSHEECIACHTEVGDRDPLVSTRAASGACKKCHTRDNQRVTHEPRPFRYVNFSHDNHKVEPCETCHVTVTTQLVYEPVIRSALYPLPMEACKSCHEEQRIATGCISCHRSHHNYITQDKPTRSVLEHVSLLTMLICLLTVSVVAIVYNYARQQKGGG